MNKEELLKTVSMNLRSVTQSSKGGVPLKNLQNDYKCLIGKDVPCKELGYNSLEAFLRSIPSVICLKKNKSDLIAEAVADASTAHIASLIAKQKGSKLPKAKAAKKPSYVTRKYPSHENRNSKLTSSAQSNNSSHIAPNEEENKSLSQIQETNNKNTLGQLQNSIPNSVNIPANVQFQNVSITGVKKPSVTRKQKRNQRRCQIWRKEQKKKEETLRKKNAQTVQCSEQKKILGTQQASTTSLGEKFNQTVPTAISGTGVFQEKKISTSKPIPESVKQESNLANVEDQNSRLAGVKKPGLTLKQKKSQIRWYQIGRKELMKKEEAVRKKTAEIPQCLETEKMLEVQQAYTNSLREKSNKIFPIGISKTASSNAGSIIRSKGSQSLSASSSTSISSSKGSQSLNVQDSIAAANFNSLLMLNFVIFGDSYVDILKRSILSFDGFSFTKGSKEWKQKELFLSTLPDETIKECLRLLCLDSKDESTDTLLRQLLNFLALPINAV